MHPIRSVLLDTIAAIRPVVASAEVARCWSEPSALPEFSVGGLSGHLVRAIVTVSTYLDRQPPVDDQPISAAVYYSNLDSDISNSVNVGIRRRGEEAAAGGPEQLVGEFDRVAGRLHEQMRTEPDNRVVTVAGNETMLLDEYLRTRIVELVVHTDDLAHSVGLAVPSLPAPALMIVIETLVETARYRHGDLAVVRALSRRERDPLNVLRVF